MISSYSALLSQAPKTTDLIATHTAPSLSGDISLGIIIEYISLCCSEQCCCCHCVSIRSRRPSLLNVLFLNSPL